MRRYHHSRVGIVSVFFLALSCAAGSATAQGDDGPGARWQRFKQIRETQKANKEAVVSEESLGAVTENTHNDAYAGRDMLVYVPSSLPPAVRRSLLVVLHGGGGNARFMLEHLKINGVAEKHGFVVAYLNGSAAARVRGDKLKAWNAGGGCCGKAYSDRVDDVGYITGAVRYLQEKYQVAPGRTVGAGHSNGAIMMQTMACVTGVFTKVASLAGTLMADAPACHSARQHTIFNYHGELDANLPIAGGYGTKGATNISFAAQTNAKERFENAGGRYVLTVIPGADHSVEHLSQASLKQDGMTIAERLARDLDLLASY